jgi:hypothetical protein
VRVILVYVNGVLQRRVVFDDTEEYIRQCAEMCGSADDDRRRAFVPVVRSK